MYWLDRGTHRIQRANLDGSNVESLVTTGLSTPRELALDVDAGKMYWTDQTAPDKIQRANLDGSQVEDLVTAGLVGPAGLALDVAAGRMYWTDQRTGKIQRANLDGSSVQDLVTGTGRPPGAGPGRGRRKDVLDRLGHRQDPTGQPRRIQRGGPRHLGTPRSHGPGLGHGGDGKIYWTDWSTDKIQRANLDGSQVEDLVTTGLSLTEGLALDTGRRQDVLDRLGHRQDSTGRPRRVQCRGSRHDRTERAHGTGPGDCHDRPSRPP